jgi:hypothetical protein
MGADFTYAICKIPVDTNNTMILSGDNLKRAVKQRFLKLSVEEDLFTRTLEDCGVYADDAERVNSLADEIADFLANYGVLRDVSDLHLDGKHYFITGGMSWGDEPTDSYPTINLIDALGITEEPFTDEELA